MVVPVLGVHELTPDWLTEALVGDGRDGVVEAVTPRPIGTGQMSGSFRLNLTWSPSSGPDLPRSVVAKLASPDPAIRATAGASAYTAECRFYADLADALPVPTPRCWYAGMADDASCFTLLLEDCSPAEQGDQIAGCSIDEARAAIEAVAALHAATWCAPTMRDLPFLLRFDGEIAAPLQDFFVGLVPAYVERLAITAEDAAVLAEFAAGLAGWLTARPERYSLLHNDYRLDNLLFDPRDSAMRPVTVVDWQTLSTGLPARDIAYFLGTGLLPEHRREAERDLVSAYSAKLAAAGVSTSDRAQLWEDYIVGLFQVPLISVLGAMTSAATDRGDEMFRTMTARAATAIRDLDALDLLA